MRSYQIHVLYRDTQACVHCSYQRCMFCVEEGRSTLHTERERLFNGTNRESLLFYFRPPTSLCFTAKSIETIPLDPERRKLSIVSLSLIQPCPVKVLI